MAQEIKVCVLGARANTPVEAAGYRLHAGVLIDDKLLFDIGESQFLRYDPMAIFISHLHPDHALFIDQPLKINVRVYGPEANGLVQALSSAMQFEDYKITPLPTIHSQRIKSQGYIIEKGAKKILYTGDVAAITSQNLETLPRLDVVVTEASFGRSGGMLRYDKQSGQPFGHTGIPDLIKMFQPYTNRIILMHFGKWFIKDITSGQKHITDITPPGIQIDIAKDGVCYQV